MREPLISVLMVNYNHESTIEESIRSVLNQTYKNLRLIIVDDGSTDRSCAIIEQIEDSRIELYKLEKNRHICYATNYGFQKITGEYLARIDSDDVWYPDKLEKQMQFLKENPEYKICFTWIDLIDENGRNINKESKGLVELFETKFTGQSDCLHTFFFLGNCLSHPSVLMETEVMRKTGGFTMGYMQAHDFDYWVRIAKQYPIYVMQERLLAMRRFMHPDKSQTNNSNTSEINSVRFYNEYIDMKTHFFDNMEEELFIQTFQNDFRCRDSRTLEELECEKAFLLLKNGGEDNKAAPAGIQKFFELFEKPGMADLLEKKYQFTVKDFYQITGLHTYYDSWTEEVRKENDVLKQQNKRLKQNTADLTRKIEELEAAVNEYANSTSWKITKPFRVMKDSTRRKKRAD